MAENDLLQAWPHAVNGAPEEAAFLCTQPDFPDQLALFCSLLESFGIPHYIRRPGASSYMNLLFGHSASTGGVEVYVPVSRLDDAQALLAAPPIWENELGQ